MPAGPHRRAHQVLGDAGDDALLPATVDQRHAIEAFEHGEALPQRLGAVRPADDERASHVLPEPPSQEAREQERAYHGGEQKEESERAHHREPGLEADRQAKQVHEQRADRGGPEHRFGERQQVERAQSQELALVEAERVEHHEGDRQRDEHGPAGAERDGLPHLADLGAEHEGQTVGDQAETEVGEEEPACGMQARLDRRRGLAVHRDQMHRDDMTLQRVLLSARCPHRRHALSPPLGSVGAIASARDATT